MKIFQKTFFRKLVKKILYFFGLRFWKLSQTTSLIDKCLI